MELKITFNNVAELKTQMVEIMEAFEPVQQYQLPIQDTSHIFTPEKISELLADPVVKAEDIEVYEEVRPKRGRKTKADRQKELVKPEPVHVPTDEDDETQTNFYSPVEFKLGFPRIMSALIDGGHLTHQNLNDYAQMYSVKFILEMTKHPEKLDAFYKQLVAEKVIVEKGDY